MPFRGLLPTLLILLCLLNALLLAAALGAFGREPLAGRLESPREPQRLGQQVRAERFLPAASEAASEAASAAAGEPASAPATAPAGASGPVAPAAANPAARPAAAAPLAASAIQAVAAPAQPLAAGRPLPCVEIGGLSGDAARELSQALAGAGRVEAFERQEQVRWWVHLPSQPSREQVQRKLGELRRRNVTDVSVVAAGTPQTFTVSLGLFRERERAEHYLEILRGLGVRTAVLSDTPHQLTRQWLRVRDVDAAQRTRLEAIRRRFGAADLQACA
ncbi:hypothetical protein BKK79_09870 [Cupriavidus sp. USMAA2-4]|uniref:hypothetical protein n=1 Tax=Cupriavidus sp. USMAA2-4 TaxID=876364 RepID=UPI0008A6F6A2|nr:hypothetical protein [Cupriavidus sp. USMAA2-4]AOY94105.1 hypothetical protein BKK79_09870 [Cupriavidus sp. USMAA2-4]